MEPFTDAPRVLVMGIGKSGLAVSRLLLERGATVVVTDKKDRSEVEEAAAQLESWGAEVVLGGHPDSLFDPPPNFIVKNPGISYKTPIVMRAMELGLPIYTEIEVAAGLIHAPIYAITGSNGKTTTTTLVGEILSDANMQPIVAGNIGRALSDVVMEASGEHPIVLEVSSFQLQGTEHFHPKVAAILNIYPAHLDYHGDISSYFNAKWRIFKNMQATDTAVLNFDQPMLRERAMELSARVHWFSRTQMVENGACLENGFLVLRSAGESEVVLPASEVALRGDPQMENALAAAAIAAAAGATASDIAGVLRRFRGVEHRLEYVATIRGVEYYNDSKATNPTAALGAIRAFTPPVVWIGGGLERGDDFSVMVNDLRQRVRVAILLGESKESIAKACKHADVVVHFARSIQDAVSQAASVAKSGEVVLLSPACASWDMFKSFEERGSMFKESVHKL